MAEIRARLLAWYDEVKRDLPWRLGTEPDRSYADEGERSPDPYAVWVSEIMLQQTKVATALPYFERWMQEFPTVQALAEARQEDVLRLWQGLGYYARARNLHRAAKRIAERYDEEGFPQSYAEWIELPGVGKYTAGAIASIAFGEEVPAVDGNVRRVMSRIHALEGDPSRGECARQIQAHAAILAKGRRPGDLNQSLMELGASHCSPRNPNCDLCPISAHCRAFAEGRQAQLPTPKKRAKPRELQGIACRILDLDGRCIVLRRPDEGLLGGLWEYPIWVWPGSDLPPAALDLQADDIVDLLRLAGWEFALEPEPIALHELGPIRHVFSHIDMRLICWELRLRQLPVGLRRGGSSSGGSMEEGEIRAVSEQRAAYAPHDSKVGFGAIEGLRPAADYAELRLVSVEGVLEAEDRRDALPVSTLMQKMMRMPMPPLEGPPDG